MGQEIIHVVRVAGAPTTPPDLADRLEEAVQRVREAVPGIVEATHGPSVSVEGLERGFDHGLYVRFADAAARDAYLPHPAHLPLADLITAHAANLVVFDLTGL